MGEEGLDPTPTHSTSVPPGLWSWQWKDAMAEGKADTAFSPSSSRCPRPPHMTLLACVWLVFNTVLKCPWLYIFAYVSTYAKSFSWVSNALMSVCSLSLLVSLPFSAGRNVIRFAGWPWQPVLLIGMENDPEPLVVQFRPGTRIEEACQSAKRVEKNKEKSF